MATKTKNRKTVEIYFILYLAALILLIPEAKDNNEVIKEISTNSDINFDIDAEKSNMNCIVTRDSLGNYIYTLDSINTIYYSGKVENVNFEFFVEDISLNHKVKIADSSDNTRFFKIKEIDALQIAEFYWHPPLSINSDKVYNVEVKAKGFYTNQAGRVEELESFTSFSLNVNFLINDINMETIAYENNEDESSRTNTNNFENSSFRYSALPSLRLYPQNANLNTAPLEKWENIIYVSGLNPKEDLRDNPSIKVLSNSDNNPGNAVIIDILKDRLIMGGKSPESGTMSVQLTLKRQQDGSEVTTEFSVNSESISDPFYKEIMFPDISYIIDPNLPLLTNEKTTALLIDQDGNILAKSNRGMEFNFEPKESDVGKVIYLERRIDDQIYGQRYRIQILNYPIPEIIRVQRLANNKLRIYTNSYGVYNNKTNYIEKINIIEGQIDYEEKIGLAQENNENTISQVFEIQFKSNSEPSFKIQLVNLKGQKSEIFSYPN